MSGKALAALQMYSIRSAVERNVAAALKSVAELGYRGGELWGYAGDDLTWMGTPASDLRKMYDNAGLACCGMHVTTDALMGDKLKRTIELNQILGNKYLIVVTDKPRMQSGVESIKELAGILNGVAGTLTSLGMFTGYHAHPHDFIRIGAETAWEILFSHTIHDVVMQLDVVNCVNGGSDPSTILRKFPGRVRTIHLQDLGGNSGALADGKQVDWDDVFSVLDTLHSVEWCVVKELKLVGDGFVAAERRLTALKDLRTSML